MRKLYISFCFALLAVVSAMASEARQILFFVDGASEPELTLSLEDAIATMDRISIERPTDGSLPTMTVHFNNGDLSVPGLDSISFVGQNDPSVPTDLGFESQSELYVFPNPVSDYLTIVGADADAICRIFNTSGDLVLTTIGLQVSVAALPAGVYFLQLDSLPAIRFIKK